MGKMKELFMEEYYPEYDLEREYLINDMIAQEQRYQEYLALKKELNQQQNQKQTLNTKIEIGDYVTNRETTTQKNDLEELFDHQPAQKT